MTAFFGNGRLANISRVVQLTLIRDGAELLLSLKLHEVESSTQVELRFHNVSDLKFRGQRTELTELVLLMAEDVSSHGWEGVHFAVNDYEEEFISFRCERIERA
jgi:hypothetical protein